LKTISIFGSTGHVGKKAFEASLDSGFKIVSLTGNKNQAELMRQASIASPKYVCVSDEESYKLIKEELSSRQINVLPGSEIDNLASLEVDICFMSISGISAVGPALSCLGHAKRLAIASKEAILMVGPSLQLRAPHLGTEIIPVDSEHNSIWQALIGEDMNEVERIIITASGGPFVDLEEGDLANVTLKDALRHPRWTMGREISIDSATLMNKAKEIIEAAYLFGIDAERITPLIHPDSIVHGIVEFKDGFSKAMLSHSDMMYSISNALNYPKRRRISARKLDLMHTASINFREPKQWQRRNMDIAYRVLQEGMVADFVNANDRAVSLFIDGSIKFNEIYWFIINELEEKKK
jgi:1-deoxy-D-xylulose-5-phosphate reductoisomerase